MYAQPSGEAWREAGIPYIQNFSPADHGQGGQSWYSVQDENGVMYFGNNSGLIEFDGVNWRLHQLPKRTVVRSILLHDEKIYVSSYREIGYFKRNQQGSLEYHSMMPLLPEEHRNFLTAWNVFYLNGDIFFRTTTSLIRFRGESCRVWSSETRFHHSYQAGNEVFVTEKGRGLLYLKGDSLLLAPGWEAFDEINIFAFLPYDSTRWLIATRNNGLLLYDKKRVQPFAPELKEFIRRSRLYYGLKLPNGQFALGSIVNGLIILDQSGTVQQVFSRLSGLQDDYITHISVDRENGIWLTHNNGISRIEYLSPLTRYRHELGLRGTILKTIRFKGVLYAVSTSGLYKLNLKGNQPPLPVTSGSTQTSAKYFPGFSEVPGISNQIWNAQEVYGELLICANTGLHVLRGNRLERIYEWSRSQPSCVYQPKDYPEYLMVGTWAGLSIMTRQNNRWVFVAEIPGIDGRVVNIIEDPEGGFWLSMYKGQAYRVTLSGNEKLAFPSRLQIEAFGQESGLPLNNVHVALVNNEAIFATQRGIKSFDTETKRFVADSRFGEVFADSSTWVFYLGEDEQKNAWIVAGNKQRLLNGKAVYREDGSYRWEDLPFRRLSDMGDTYHILPEKNGTLWFCGSEGIARYLTDGPAIAVRPFNTLIRETMDIRRSTPLQMGSGTSASLELPHEKNSLRLNFSAPSFSDITANKFQFILDGFDDNWSDWTDETRKDYTGIFEGDYTFRVRSKNIYGLIGEEAALDISIAPPWYRSYAAYFVYLLLCSGLIFALLQTRVRRYKKQQERLENMITERTAQIVEQRNQLAVQSEKLQELDELKSQFFANISHEFRTPLTLIIGMIDKLKKQAATSSSPQELELIEHNAGRLLNLINQLLDLSKLEAGELKIAVSENDIARFMRRIYASFASLAPQRDITMTLNGIPFEQTEEDSVIAWFDIDKLEKVFYNLLSNAFKFTPARGRVDLSYTVDSASSQIIIAVLNTGPGIPPEKLPHIFERFYQVEGSSKREFEGTGIGLALVRELVELHHGSVTAASEPGSETVFTLHLPLSKTAFDDSEIQLSADDIEQELSVTASDIASLSTDSPYAADTSSDAEMEEADSDKTLVLIVEDQRDLRRFIRENLEGEFSVIEAENGRIGVEKAIGRIPDLIISDVMMPEMDGYELCASLKTNEKTDHIPIILLTAKAATDDKMEGLQTGADDYLLKPFNPDELLVRVRNLIKIRRQMRDKFSNEMLLRPTDITVSSVHQVFLEKVTGIIESHMDDEEFSVEGLAGEVGMSRGQLHRKLKALTNQSASEFVRNFRLQRAAELIKQNAGNIAEIAYEVGFSSQAYFTRCFQEQFNCSPTEYRKRNQ